MTLYIAAQNFSVQVSGVDVEIRRGDFWDSTTTVYAEATASSVVPPLFVPLPDGITAHQVSYDWEG